MYPSAKVTCMLKIEWLEVGESYIPTFSQGYRSELVSLGCTVKSMQPLI